MSVKLRERKKGKKISLYLDIYDNGKRGYEYLKLYLFPKPDKGRLTNEQKDHNEKVYAIANRIASERELQYINEQHNLSDKTRLKGSFILYMQQLAQKREEVQGNHGNWLSAIKHLKTFDKDVVFSDISKAWIEAWKDYLLNKAKSDNGKNLKQNTKLSYYSKVIAAIKEAHRDGILKYQYTDMVKGIEPEEPRKEFLTEEEVKAMSKAECELPMLKAAFLFSCYTGLRWSDVSTLKWKDIQHSADIGYFMRLKQKKTDTEGTIPVSNEAIQLLGERGESNSKVFEGLLYSAWNNVKLSQWVMRAGISKKITFHCSRHTFATSLLTKGIDLYVVQSLLLHKSVKNTQVYGKIVDQKRKEAVDKLNFTSI